MTQKTSKWQTLKFILFLSVGFGILLYPLITAVYYDYQSTTEVKQYKSETKTMEELKLEERIKQAKAYNATLSENETLLDFFTADDIKKGEDLYADMLKVNEMIGTIRIPRIHQELPVYAGTKETVLQKGIGHLERTSLPVGGESSHSVVTGHRGLPDKKLFTDLPKVKKGDLIFFTNMKETLAYKVFEIREVTPDQTEVLNIREGKDLLTLITCTPYMINSHRLIVTAERIPYSEELVEVTNKDHPGWKRFISVYQNYLIGTVIFITILILYHIWRSRSIKNQQNK
ncbi:class C sortase [Phocicoccus pinnipedialis]|uniref:Sortase family protein n=1 Tax=Phocicoccus pinnipedialis TaxID=110845 RepID=A0A6V7R4S1_9BACL|nr:class C sortase [Jeotgalicoccus pinnipedialis]MBP1940018.1 sortase A [Jeotgalicoccus pinnipedialis]CAD2072034.1 hypothetical protein JEOPIN946_00232 [Jeotgalicoccus pinnipedialis]